MAAGSPKPPAPPVSPPPPLISSRATPPPVPPTDASPPSQGSPAAGSAQGAAGAAAGAPAMTTIAPTTVAVVLGLTRSQLSVDLVMFIGLGDGEWSELGRTKAGPDCTPHPLLLHTTLFASPSEIRIECQNSENGLVRSFVQLSFLELLGYSLQNTSAVFLSPAAPHVPTAESLQVQVQLPSSGAEPEVAFPEFEAWKAGLDRAARMHAVDKQEENVLITFSAKDLPSGMFRKPHTVAKLFRLDPDMADARSLLWESAAVKGTDPTWETLTVPMSTLQEHGPHTELDVQLVDMAKPANPAIIGDVVITAASLLSSAGKWLSVINQADAAAAEAKGEMYTDAGILSVDDIRTTKITVRKKEPMSEADLRIAYTNAKTLAGATARLTSLDRLSLPSRFLKYFSAEGWRPQLSILLGVDGLAACGCAAPATCAHAAASSTVARSLAQLFNTMGTDIRVGTWNSTGANISFTGMAEDVPDAVSGILSAGAADGPPPRVEPLFNSLQDEWANKPSPLTYHVTVLITRQDPRDLDVLKERLQQVSTKNVGFLVVFVNDNPAAGSVTTTTITKLNAMVPVSASVTTAAVIMGSRNGAAAALEPMLQWFWRFVSTNKLVPPAPYAIAKGLRPASVMRVGSRRGSFRGSTRASLSGEGGARLSLAVLSELAAVEGTDAGANPAPASEPAARPNGRPSIVSWRSPPGGGPGGAAGGFGGNSATKQDDSDSDGGDVDDDESDDEPSAAAPAASASTTAAAAARPTKPTSGPQSLVNPLMAARGGDSPPPDPKPVKKRGSLVDKLLRRQG